MSTTIVTAYYPIKNKYNNNDIYLYWMKLLLENIEGPFVIFTDEKHKDIFNQYRKNYPSKTHIIAKDFYSYEFTSDQMIRYWQYQWNKDPEYRIHNYLLYAMWSLKQEFVKMAIDLDIFNSQYYVWCDAGILREDHYIHLIKNFPSNIQNVYMNNKILALNVADKIIGAGILAGNKDAWALFCEFYRKELYDSEKSGLFTGKEQDMYERIHDKYELFQLIKPKKWFDSSHPHNDSVWFYLLYYLSNESIC